MSEKPKYTKIENSKLEAYMKCELLPTWFRIQLWIDRNLEGWNRDEFVIKKSKWKYAAEQLNMPRGSFFRGLRIIEAMGNYEINRKKKVIKKVTGVALSLKNVTGLLRTHEKVTEVDLSLSEKGLENSKNEKNLSKNKNVTALALKTSQLGDEKSNTPVTPHPINDNNISKEHIEEKKNGDTINGSANNTESSVEYDREQHRLAIEANKRRAERQKELDIDKPKTIPMSEVMDEFVKENS